MVVPVTGVDALTSATLVIPTVINSRRCRSLALRIPILKTDKVRQRKEPSSKDADLRSREPFEMKILSDSVVNEK